jgi:hypothetical protein
MIDSHSFAAPVPGGAEQFERLLVTGHCLVVPAKRRADVRTEVERCPLLGLVSGAPGEASRFLVQRQRFSELTLLC